MIEEWLLKFVLSCLAFMSISAWALHAIENAGKDFVDKSDENGKE